MVDLFQLLIFAEKAVSEVTVLCHTRPVTKGYEEAAHAQSVLCPWLVQ